MGNAIEQATTRRAMLRLPVIGAAICPACLAARCRVSAAETHTAPHWSYEGATGPGGWGRLSPDFKVCELSLEQSPIDVTNGIKAEFGGVEFDYRPMPLRILNNGHTIQVNCEPGSRARINGSSYELVQFHFHHPSEHLLSGIRLDLECHFVHRAASGALAVVAVFVRPGADNAALDPIWRAMPASEAPERGVGTTINPAGLFPRSRAYFQYFGSLTTPPCSEGVLWTVFGEPVEASAEQIRRFAQLFPMNARPVRQLNRRSLLKSF